MGSSPTVRTILLIGVHLIIVAGLTSGCKQGDILTSAIVNASRAESGPFGGLEKEEIGPESRLKLAALFLNAQWQDGIATHPVSKDSLVLVLYDGDEVLGRVWNIDGDLFIANEISGKFAGSQWFSWQAPAGYGKKFVSICVKDKR